MVGAYSGIKKEYEPIKKITDRILGIAGIWIFCYSVSGFITKPNEFWKFETLKGFVFAPLMTAGFLPFIFAWTLFTEYEGFFTRVGFFHKNNPELARKMKLIGVRYAKFNPWKLRQLWRRNLNKFINAGSEADLPGLLVMDENSVPENY
jgi:hypothetical protein